MTKDTVGSKNLNQDAATNAATDSQETRPDARAPLESKAPEQGRSMSDRPSRPSRSDVDEATRKYEEKRKHRTQSQVGVAENAKGIFTMPPSREGFSYFLVRNDNEGISKALAEGYVPVPRSSVPEEYRGPHQADDLIHYGDLVLYEILNIELEDNNAKVKAFRDSQNLTAQEKLEIKDRDGKEVFAPGSGLTHTTEQIQAGSRVPKVADNSSFN